MTENVLQQTTGTDAAQSIKARYPELLTTTQAAEILSVSGRTIARLCISGDIKAVKIRGQWRINRDALCVTTGLC